MLKKRDYRDAFEARSHPNKKNNSEDPSSEEYGPIAQQPINKEMAQKVAKKMSEIFTRLVAGSLDEGELTRLFCNGMEMLGDLEAELVVQECMKPGVILDQHNNVVRYNQRIDLPQPLQDFLNSWLIKYSKKPLKKQGETSDDLIPRTPEPKKKEETQLIQETPKKQKLTTSYVLNTCTNEHGLAFVQRNSRSEKWADMCLQEFSVVQLIREAIGCLAPKYIFVLSNVKYKSQSVNKKIEEERSTISVRHIKPDMVIELNSKQFPHLKPHNPFYILTMEVQKEPFTDIREHKDFFKVCFVLRNMLNDTMRTFSPENEKLTTWGVLAGLNGVAFLSLTTNVVKPNTNDQQKALFFKLKTSQIYHYNDANQIAQCRDMLRSFVVGTIVQFDQLKQTDEKFMDSVKASKVATNTYKESVVLCEIVNPSNCGVVIKKRCEELPEVEMGIFSKVRRIMRQVDEKITTEEIGFPFMFKLMGSLADRSLGFIQQNGKFHIVSVGRNCKVDLLWRDKSGYHIRRGTLRDGVFEKAFELTNNTQDDYSNNDDSDNDHQQNKKDNSSRKRFEGKESNNDSRRSSNSSRNFVMNYCSSIEEIVEEQGFTTDRELIRNSKCFAFISHKSQSTQCPVFVKFSIGTVDEEKVMSEVPKHRNLVQILKHERVNKVPIDWKTKMESDDEDKNMCYLTVTEILVPYDQYLSYSKIQKLSGRSKLKILDHLMSGIMKGVKVLHKKRIIHGDLSIWNIMFRKSNIVVENDFELHDAVIIDMNCSYSLTHSITGSIGRTRPFVCEEDFLVNTAMDIFSIGILFAHYLKRMLTGDEWFIHPVTDTIKNEKCHKMISKYMNESNESFVSTFGEEYSTCLHHMKAIIGGCMITDWRERMNLRNLEKIKKAIRQSIVQAPTFATRINTMRLKNTFTGDCS